MVNVNMFLFAESNVPAQWHEYGGFYAVNVTLAISYYNIIGKRQQNYDDGIFMAKQLNAIGMNELVRCVWER